MYVFYLKKFTEREEKREKEKKERKLIFSIID